MNMVANRFLLALVLVHAAASLVHFVHNATFLAEYPNMPGWISLAGIYGVWLAWSTSKSLPEVSAETITESTSC